MEKLFKDCEDVKAEIRNCDLIGNIFHIVCFVFAALGVMGDALIFTLRLESMIWFLLVIVAGLNAIIPHMHVVIAKHLLSIESESKE